MKYSVAEYKASFFPFAFLAETCLNFLCSLHYKSSVFD